MPEEPTAERAEGEGAEGPPARLTVRLEGGGDDDAVGLPVEVRTDSLRPAASGWTNEPMALPAGQYVVSARIPGGPPLLAEVALAPGEEHTVVLTAGAAASPAPGLLRPAAAGLSEIRPATAGLSEIRPAAAGARRHDSLRDTPGGSPGPPLLQSIVRLPPRLPAAAAVAPSAAAAPAPALQPGRPVRTVTFLLLTGNPLAGPLRGADAPSARIDLGGPGDLLRTEIAGGGKVLAIPSRTADGVALALRADRDLPERTFALLRMTEPAAPVRFIALPLAWGHAIRIRLDQVSGEDALRVTVETDDPTTEALLLYRKAGQMDEARALVARHREESFGAEVGAVPPLRLAVIALLTLRLADPREWKSGPFYGRLLEAAEKLDFPDLHAASAEIASRRGEMDQARLFAARATARGLPYLSDALALLHARVLEAARPPDPDTEMREIYQRLSPLLGLVDLKAPLVTLRGGDEQLFQPEITLAEGAALDSVEAIEPDFQLT